MIDIYIDEKYNIDQATNLMMTLFEIDKNHVVVCQFDDLDKIVVPDDVSCLCVMSDVKGDVNTLLSLHIISMDFELFVQKLSRASDLFNGNFFIPHDNLNGYLKIHHQSVQQVFLDEEHSDGQFMYFVE